MNWCWEKTLQWYSLGQTGYQISLNLYRKSTWIFVLEVATADAEAQYFWASDSSAFTAEKDTHRWKDWREEERGIRQSIDGDTTDSMETVTGKTGAVLMGSMRNICSPLFQWVEPESYRLTHQHLLLLNT